MVIAVVSLISASLIGNVCFAIFVFSAILQRLKAVDWTSTVEGVLELTVVGSSLVATGLAGAEPIPLVGIEVVVTLLGPLIGDSANTAIEVSRTRSTRAIRTFCKVF